MYHSGFKHVDTSYLVSEWNDTRQQSDEDVRVHAAFMGLVDDYCTVPLEQEVLRQDS